jgi:hypothetical protein
MSEIKGQLLGIVLVVAVFGAISGVLVASFKAASENIAEKIEDTTEPAVTAVTSIQENIYSIDNYKLLKY